MKKLALSLSVVLAMGMVACSDSQQDKAEDSAVGMQALDSVNNSEGVIDDAVVDEGDDTEIIISEEGEDTPQGVDASSEQSGEDVEAAGAQKAADAKAQLTGTPATSETATETATEQQQGEQ